MRPLILAAAAAAVIAATPALAAIPAAEYAPEAAQVNLFEIQAGQMALSRSGSTQVRDFARRMIDDHKAAARALNNAFAGAGTPADFTAVTMDARHEAMLHELSRAAGPAFDQLYMDQQLAAAHEALALHRHFAHEGDPPALRAVANNMANQTQKDLEVLQSMGAH